MARQVILKGTVANDGTGDNLRVTATKINSNFEELYTTLATLTPYTLPPATRVRLGGVKVGDGLSVNPDGVIQVDAVPTRLTDLNIVDGTDGQVLTTDGNGNFTFEDAGAGVTNLDALTDVTLTSPTANQILKYNGTQWVNSAPASANPFDQSLNTTNDVDFNKVTTGEVVLDGSGTPTVQSDTDLYIAAGSKVKIITKSPFKFANMTTTERDAFTAENGDVVYNTTVSKLQVYAAGSWVNLH